VLPTALYTTVSVRTHPETRERSRAIGQHWACVKMICAYRDKATLYILLEMVQGGELFRYLDQKGRLPEKTVCFYAANVYLALDHLHSKGVIHRDLKPENLLIDPDGYIKLVDFGFAKHVRIPRLRADFTLS
jgi:protein kinase A